MKVTRGTNNELEYWYTLQEAAEIIGLHHRTMQKKLQDKTLKAVKIGSFNYVSQAEVIHQFNARKKDDSEPILFPETECLVPQENIIEDSINLDDIDL